MELKGRLRKIAEFVEECGTVCDVGTDHAYVPIYLIIKGICSNALATDLRKGPLEKARHNIEKYGLNDRIETRLGGGLEPVSAGEAETIVIAGMGGRIIAEILAEGSEKPKKVRRLILQPMNAPEVLREWLYTQGYDILDEALVKDERKLYSIIAARWEDKPVKKPNFYYHIGEALIKKRDPLLVEYLSRRIYQLEKELKGLEMSSSSHDIMTEKKLLKEEMEKLKQMIELEN